MHNLADPFIFIRSLVLVFTEYQVSIQQINASKRESLVFLNSLPFFIEKNFSYLFSNDWVENFRLFIWIPKISFGKKPQANSELNHITISAISQ